MSSEINEEVIQNTQKVLGKYIKKPALTEKLLRKPPFRFLHDIVNNVIRETGFLKGLYSERELVSENVKNKDDKIAFLNKLVDAIKSITGKELAVRPTKVIAGLEPTETNLLLQAIGAALDSKLSSTQYVHQLKTGKKPKTERDSNKKNLKVKEKTINSVDNKSKVVSNTPRIKQHNEKALTKSNKVSSSRESKENKTAKDKPKKKNEEKISPTANKTVNEGAVTEDIATKEPDIILDVVNSALDETATDKNESDSVQKNEENEKKIEEISGNKLEEDIKVPTPASAKRERVKSAKPKSSRLRALNDLQNLSLSTESANEDVPLQNSTEPQEKPNEKSNKLTTDTIPTTNLILPRSSLRPPSVRPSSARPGAPRLRSDINLSEGELIPLGKVNVILENYTNKDADEEETVTIQAVSEPEYQPPVLELPADKGHLVEQILEQINQDDVIEHAKPIVNIEWEQNGLRNKNAINKEIDQLKSAIQTLTRTANPLGKLVNYLHEDIDAMHTELDMWTNSARQTMSEINNQKRVNDDSHRPLTLQLEEIEENIQTIRQQIISIHGNILHNESRIRDLLVNTN